VQTGTGTVGTLTGVGTVGTLAGTGTMGTLTGAGTMGTWTGVGTVGTLTSAGTLGTLTGTGITVRRRNSMDVRRGRYPLYPARYDNQYEYAWSVPWPKTEI
jgi:hypothetical protein